MLLGGTFQVGLRPVAVHCSVCAVLLWTGASVSTPLRRTGPLVALPTAQHIRFAAHGLPASALPQTGTLPKVVL